MDENDKKLPVVMINGHRQRKSFDSEYMGQASSYKEEFNQLLLDHLSSGFSFASFSAVLYEEFRLKTSSQTLYNWLDRFPDFRLSKETGESLGLHLYEKLLISLSTGTIPDSLKVKGVKRLNFKVIAYILSTRFFKTYPMQNQAKQIESDNQNVIQISIDEDENGL